MAQKKVSSELALSSTFNAGEVVMSLTQKINELEHIEKPPVTSGQLTINGNSFVISKAEKTEELIAAYGWIKRTKEAYDEAAQELGVKQYPEKQFNGYTIDQWKKDIVLRIEFLNKHNTLEKLKELKTKAESFITQEDKKALFMQELENFVV